MVNSLFTVQVPGIQGGLKTRCHRLITIILSNRNQLKKNSPKDCLVNLQINRYTSNRTLHMLLHYLVKHQCQQKAINNKLQGSVATYLRCGGAVSNQIKKGLLLSLRVNFFSNW